MRRVAQFAANISPPPAAHSAHAQGDNMQDVLGEPVDPSWLEPLWTDERMGRECAFAAAEYQEANNRFDLGGVKYSYEIVAKRMRDEYERDRSNFQAVYEQYISKPDSDADRARLVAQVAELEAELARLTNERNSLARRCGFMSKGSRP